MKITHRIIHHRRGDGAETGRTLIYCTRDGWISFVTFNNKDQPLTIKSFDEREAREVLTVLKEILGEN